MEKLPKGWVDCKVGEISEIIRGVSYKKHEASTISEEGSFLVLRGGNIQDGNIITDSEDSVYVNSSLIKNVQKVSKGDVIIVGSTGSKKLIGKAGIALTDLNNVAFGAFLMLVRPNETIKSKYFDYYFLSDEYRNTIRLLAGGVNINNIRKEYITGLKFPLPPLAEQHRIVAKLDTLFASLERSKSRLDKIPLLLKNFKQAVLTQAVTGKLTEEWREGKELEDGLKVISQNRIELYDKRVQLAKDKGERKPKKLDETLFEFFAYEDNYNQPKKWELANLKNIADLITDGEHSTPKRTEDGFYLLSARNVQNGYISLNKVDYVPKDEYIKLRKRCNPEFMDVLISCSGTVGRVSIVPNDLDFVMVRSAALLKLQSNKESSKYIEFALRSRIAQDQMLKLQKSTAQANLFIGPIGKIVIPVPPIKEQQEIVSRVESLFAKADAIEARYGTLKQKVDTLPQALLAKAFKGELVAQLPTDGDANELLAEIQKAKESIKPTAKGKGRKKK